jgi:Raf kinase inhibitor-like YbhB/YbcL family protein
MELELRSPVFQEGQEIPARYTADGQNLSPPLEWSNPPDGTQEFVLFCEDAERLIGAAPSIINATSDHDATFVHWIVTGLSSHISALPEGLPPTASLSALAARQGTNSFGRIGYSGPDHRDGSGRHRYLFRLFALDRPLYLPPGATREDCLRAMEGHLLNEGMLIGVALHAGASAA